MIDSTVEVRNCFLKARSGETLLFGPGTQVVGYAIVPIEEYNELMALAYGKPGPFRITNNHLEASNVD